MDIDIDRSLRYFIELFHGYITAYLVYSLTDVAISDVYFIVLVIAFSVVNVIFMRLLLSVICVLVVFFKMFSQTVMDFRREDLIVKFGKFEYDFYSGISNPIFISSDGVLKKKSIIDVLFLTLSSIICAGVLSYSYQEDWLYRAASSTYGFWHKKHDRDPLAQYFVKYCNDHGGCQNSVGNNEENTDAAYEFIRIWWKDRNLITSGYLTEVPSRRDNQIVQLDYVCQLIPPFAEAVARGNRGSERKYEQESNKSGFDVNRSMFVDLSDPDILFFEIELRKADNSSCSTAVTFQPSEAMTITSDPRH